MKNSRIIVLCAVILIFGIFALCQNKTDVSGYYYMPKHPTVFRDIKVIYLGDDVDRNKTFAPFGYISFNDENARVFELFKPMMNGRTISFTTETFKGISYSFSGNFVKLGNFPKDEPNDQVILKGTFIKWKGKRKIATAFVNLFYTIGG
jgi:hypothetical protein